MAEFAHFEYVPLSKVFDLYIRHAEVARDIHAQAIHDFTGRSDIEVDLVRRDPNIPSTETFDIMSQYQSISVSSGLTQFGEYMHTGINTAINEALERFEGPMPALIFAAGNDGEEAIGKRLSLTDLTRNGLTVGESNSLEGNTFVEKHSSFKPNITITNPFDTKPYHFIEMSPNLIGHERLIREYLLNSEVAQEIKKIPNFGKLSWEEQTTILTDLSNDSDRLERINKQIGEIVANPAQFHERIHGQIRQVYNFDENGFTTGVNGTSFSAPNLAGHISGAILLEEERANQNLPSLTTEEIMTIAKLSAEQVAGRESVNSRATYDMHDYTNGANQIFTSHGGHGVFSSEKFRKLLDEAHFIIENNPDIDRTNIEYKLSGRVDDAHNFSFQLPQDLDGSLIFDRMILTYETEGVPAVNALLLNKDGETPNFLDPDGYEGIQWVATDRYFGETLLPEHIWEVEAITYQNQGRIIDPSLRLYAYNENSLMGQMISTYSDNPVLQNKLDLKTDFRMGALDERSLTFDEKMYIQDFPNPEAVAAP